MKIKQIVAVLVLTMSLTGAAFSQSSANDFNTRLTTYVTETHNQLNYDYGMAVAVVKGDEIIYEGYFGTSDFSNHQKVEASDSFYIASSTKPLVALAAMRLAEKGMLDLEKSLSSCFPEVAFAAEVQADKIKLTHLINHTSGIDNSAIAHSAAYTGLHTPELQIERLGASKSLKDAPLNTFQYTNLGYNILSMVIERETGKPWQDILQKEVFTPAGMKRSSAYMSASKQEGWNTPKTYSHRNRDKHAPLSLTKEDNTMHAAGGVIATAKDLGRFLIAELNNGKIDGIPIFSPKSIATSQELSATQNRKYKIYQRTGYGYGWNIGTLKGEKLLHHFGGFAGTSAHVSFMPEHECGLVVLANEDLLAPVVNDLLASYVYDMLLEHETADKVAYGELAKWAEKAKGIDRMIKAEANKQAARTWQLSMPNESYIGQYTSDLAGTITIEKTLNDKLKLSWGNMTTIAQAFTKPESIRVEFVPNRGTVVQFTQENGQVTGLETETFSFSRKK